MQSGKVLKGKPEIEKEDLATFFMAYEDGVMNRGKAKVGEKTFLDGLDPAVEAMKRSFAEGDELSVVADKAVRAAKAQGSGRCRCSAYDDAIVVIL